MTGSGPLRRGLLGLLTAAAIAAGAAESADASALFRNPTSDIDPEIFTIDETKYLGVRPDKETRLGVQDGEPFAFGDKGGGKPLILVLSYYMCDGTCSVVNQDLAEQLTGMTRLEPGRDFRVLTLAFDKKDTLKTLNEFRDKVGLASTTPDWTWALFEKPEDIEPFTSALGYKFFWSPQDRTFFHPGVYAVVSPEGRVTRYLYALNIEPADLELALLEASTETLRPTARDLVNFAVSLCFSYNFEEGRYTYNIPMFVAFGSLTLGIGTFGAAAFAFARRRRRETT